MWGYMNHWGGMGFGMLLFWGLLIVVVAFLARNTWGSSGQNQEKSALDLLKERYARGEIGHEEFEQKRRDLEGGSS